MHHQKLDAHFVFKLLSKKNPCGSPAFQLLCNLVYSLFFEVENIDPFSENVEVCHLSICSRFRLVVDILILLACLHIIFLQELVFLTFNERFLQSRLEEIKMMSSSPSSWLKHWSISTCFSVMMISSIWSSGSLTQR